METSLQVIFSSLRYHWAPTRCAGEVADSITWPRILPGPARRAAPSDDVDEGPRRAAGRGGRRTDEALPPRPPSQTRCARNRSGPIPRVPANARDSDRFGSSAKAMRGSLRVSGSRLLGVSPHHAAGPLAGAGERADAIAARLRTRSAAGRDETQTTGAGSLASSPSSPPPPPGEAEGLLANAKQALRWGEGEGCGCAEHGIHDAPRRRRGGPGRAVNDLPSSSRRRGRSWHRPGSASLDIDHFIVSRPADSASSTLRGSSSAFRAGRGKATATVDTFRRPRRAGVRLALLLQQPQLGVGQSFDHKSEAARGPTYGRCRPSCRRVSRSVLFRDAVKANTDRRFRKRSVRAYVPR